MLLASEVAHHDLRDPNHDKQRKRVAFRHGGAPSSFDTFYTAFYADCEHEISPVTEGHRLVLVRHEACESRGRLRLVMPTAAHTEADLVIPSHILSTSLLSQVYNLVHCGQGGVPRVPSDDRMEQLMAALKAWDADEEGPLYLVHLLSHKYTTAGLGFNGLKGEDNRGGLLLATAAARGEAMVYLAKFSFWENAYDTSGGGYEYERGYEDWEVSGVAVLRRMVVGASGLG
jgi:hypothetical protein